ncbi:MAG: hypothetical protein Q9213_004695, partial [Squamulea squamosa]
MDGSPAVASGIAIASIAIQLADSVKKLHEFWSSVKEASEDIRAISLDLETLATVLTCIAFESQRARPDVILAAALEHCSLQVKQLTMILNAAEPGFASASTRVRYWTALKTVMKQRQVKKFQRALDRAKVNLLLVQQHQIRHYRDPVYAGRDKSNKTSKEYLLGIIALQTKTILQTHRAANVPELCEEHIRSTNESKYAFAAYSHESNVCAFLKDAAADTRALTWNAESPTLLAAEGSSYTTTKTLTKAVDTIRSLGDLIDPLDPLAFGSVRRNITNSSEEKDAKAALLLWMMKSFISEIVISSKRYVDDNSILLMFSFTHTSMLVDSTQFLANFLQKKTTDNVPNPTNLYSVLHHRIPSAGEENNPTNATDKAPDFGER